MYLQKIQKVLSIVEIVLKVLMVLSFVAGGILFVFGIMGISGSEEIVTKIGGINFITPVIKFDPDAGITAEGAAMLTNGIAQILNGVIFLFATQYLAKERKDGTPFTKSGADSVKKLGIISIVLSTSAAIIQAIVFEVLDVSVTADISNEMGLTAGLLLLFFSMILNYGTQLKDGTSEEASEEISKQ